MNDTTPAPPEPARAKKTVGEWLHGTAAKIAALLGIVVGILTQIPPAVNGYKSAYCSVFACITPITPITPIPPITELPLRPETKLFTHPDFVTFDSGRHKSGTISKIHVSIIDNKGKEPDTYVVQWTWSGSGGTEHGSQTVIIDLKSSIGATVQSLKLPLNRAHCYYAGNIERHEGNLGVSAANLIASVDVSVTPLDEHWWVQLGGCRSAPATP